MLIEKIDKVQSKIKELTPLLELKEEQDYLQEISKQMSQIKQMFENNDKIKEDSQEYKLLLKQVEEVYLALLDTK